MSAAVDVSRWDDFYPDTARFDEQHTVRNERNEASKDWQPAPDLQNVPCAVRFLSGDEAVAAGIVAPEASHTLKLRGYFPKIAPQMRVTVRQNGKETGYDVLAVAHTSGHSRTKLFCKTSV